MFLFFIAFVILLRMGELILTRQNEKWLLQNGAKEYGKEHYPFMIVLHTLFFVSLIVEYYFLGTETYSVFLLFTFLLLTLLKAWIVVSLGKFWTTKIYYSPNLPLVSKGLYKYFKHPNYMIVVAEIAVIPLAFHLYYTAIIFTILNAIMLTVRIKAENKALGI